MQQAAAAAAGVPAVGEPEQQEGVVKLGEN